ncbi:MAG: hypothetical protein EPN93_16355 [Spirochaetes bacterium]|nr:MAG: hypothetical protein EPN93_16355 [Spirochaetota bacterium]
MKPSIKRRAPCGTILAAVCAAALAAGCATMGTADRDALTDGLRSENALMKGRITLLQRENSVLKDETSVRRKEAGEQRSRIERLEADIQALKTQFARDIELRETRTKALEQQNEVLKKESSGKIQELTRLNGEIQKTLESELKRLNEEIAKNSAAWNGERESMKNEGARKELAFSKEIDTLRKESSQKDEEIAAGKTARAEQDARIKKLTQDLESGNDAVGRLEKLVAEMKGRLKDMEPIRGDGAKPEK